MPDNVIDTPPQIVCILGMHRSGTSLTSRILNLLGYSLGPEEHLMKPLEANNPRGFWENQLLTNLNDEILATFGGTWDAPPSFPAEWETVSELTDLRQKAQALIREDFGQAPLWSWKDPRTCLTLPFWQQLLPPMRYVIALRNPVDVTRSLQVRDGFSVAKCINLWFAYVKGALEHSVGHPRLFVFYEDIMEHSEDTLETMRDFLDRPGLTPELLRQVQLTIDQESYHHRTSLLNAVDDAELDFPVKALYAVLQMAAGSRRNGSFKGDDATLYVQQMLTLFSQYTDKARAQFRHVDASTAALHEQLVVQRQELDSATRSIESTKSQTAALQEELNVQLIALADLVTSSDLAADHNRQLTAEISRLESERERLTHRLGALDQENKTIRGDLAATSTQLASLVRAHAALTEERAEREITSAQLEELATVKNTIGWVVLGRYRRLVGDSKGIAFVHKALTYPFRSRSAKRRLSDAAHPPDETRPTILVFRATEHDQIYRTVQHLRVRFPQHEIALALPKGEEGLFGGWGGVERFYVYSTSGGLLKGALELLRSIRRTKFDAMVLPTPSGLRTPHSRFFVCFALLVRARLRLMMEPTGRIVPFELTTVLASVVDVGAFWAGAVFAKMATLLILGVVRHRAAVDESANQDSPERPLAFLVPVLPDISHTFIYRELLSVLAQFGRTRKIIVVALEEGDPFPLHDEAKELLAHTLFVPACSLTRYLVLYCYYLFSRPRQLASLIDSYGPDSGAEPDRLLFLRSRNFHGLHPTRGIMLTRLLEKEGVSHIHCYGTSYPATRAFVASNLLGVPFSLSTFVDFDYAYPFKMLNAKMQHARFVVACTEFCKGRLQALVGRQPAAKVRVIHHGLDLRPVRSAPVRPVRTTPVRVGVFTASRLVEKKGLDYLIQSCSILRRRGVACSCTIIGDGPERRRLEELVERLGLEAEVQFLGARPNHEIWETMASEDICVVPSVYCSDGERDGVPVILLEALAHSHAVISTTVSGIPELVTDGVHGLLVPDRDADALADAIERLIENPALRRHLAGAGRERVLRDFNIHDKARLLWNYIAECAEGRVATTVELPDVVREREKGPSVSTVLVNSNGAKFLQPLFDSLRRQTHPVSEVLFFDNASTDSSVELAQSLYAAVKVVRFDRNMGYSYPVNEGIRMSAADYVLVLNVDVILEDGFVEELVHALERNLTAGWASGKLLKLTPAGKSGQIDCLGHHMSRGRYATETDYSRPFDWNDYQRDRFVFGASACAALYRRSMLRDIELFGEYFDEDFFAYFEDVDLDWRAQLRGWKCLYVPTAVGYHMRGGTGLIKRPEIAACYLANRWLMLVKNDQVGHLLPDVLPFVSRFARDVWSCLRANPMVLYFGAGRFVKYLPAIWRKRGVIQKTRLTPLTYVRGLIR